MTNLNHLRAVVREYEDRKVSLADLGRAVLHAATEASDGGGAGDLRRSLTRLGHAFTALAERGLRDDVRDAARGLVDELQDTLNI